MHYADCQIFKYKKSHLEALIWAYFVIFLVLFGFHALFRILWLFSLYFYFDF
jgi:hypothetical protein